MSSLRPSDYNEENMRRFWSRTINVRKAKVEFVNSGAFLTVTALIRERCGEQQVDGWTDVKTTIRDDTEIDALLAQLEARINAVLDARFPMPPVAPTKGE